MRRSSTRLAGLEPDDSTTMETTTTSNANASKPTRRATRSSINVIVPIPAEHSSLDSSLSPSANTSSRDGSLCETPATSVMATPGDSDNNRGPSKKKRVSASARAQQLRSSALSLNTSTPATRKKRNIAEMNNEQSNTTLSDAALARELQLQEYGGMDTKRPKLSANGNGKMAVVPDSDDSEFGLDSEVSQESEHVPQSASRRRPRKSQPQGSLAADDDSDLDDDYNYSSSNDSLSDVVPSEKEEEIPATTPRRPPPSGRRGGRLPRLRRTIHDMPYGMGRRVRINCVNQKSNKF